jgi:ATP-binding cassette, subfamily B, bacterial
MSPVPPTPEPRPPGSGGWIKRLMPFVLAHKRNVVIAFGAAAVGQAVAAVAPLVQKVIVDDVIIADDRPIAPWVALLVIAALVNFVSSYIRRWVGGRVSLDVQYDLRNAIHERLQRLDFAGHDRLQTGQLVSRASSDLGLIQQLLAFLPIMLGNLVLVLVALVVMLVLSPLLAVVMLVTLPVLAIVSMRLRTTIFPATWDAQQRQGEVAGVVDEAVTGVRVVKGFGQEDRELAHLAESATALFSSRSRLVRLQARYTPTLQIVPALAQVAVLALGGWLALEGRLSLGAFLAFSTYLGQMVAPVRMMALMFAFAQQARAGAHRILDVLDANPVVVERPDAVELPPAAGDVRFEGIRFGYTQREPVLDGFDLHVRAGEVVALVGASGSGKSTVTALLPRFYDVAAGRITIDGLDVRDVTFDSLRRQVGVVFEDPFLFSDEIAANIAYGRPDATDDEVHAAAGAAGADGFIRALPDGYRTVVGERGHTLSGGQRQRVALARAILTNPRILVLDDATSAVDANTEEAIHATLREVMRDRTTILIAHRRSTLRLADRIAVIEAGHVVDLGTHEELVARSSRYRTLLAGVDDGFEADDDGALAAARDALDALERVDEPDPARADAVLDDPDVGGVTSSLWVRTDLDLPIARADVLGPPKVAPGGGRGMGGGVGNMALAATPELLAALDKLGPATDLPNVDVAAAAEAQEGAFRVTRFVRPWTRALALGFVLVALDAALTLMGPLMIRYGVDHGIEADDGGALRLAVLLFLGAVLADWVVMRIYTVITGRTAERLLFALRVKIFAHLQRLSLDYYDREMGGRVMTRMTTDVDALAQLVQTGLISAVVGLLTCTGVFVFLVILSPPLALAAASVLLPLAAATWWYQHRSDAAYEKARDSIATVNANLQESLSGVRVAQAYVREDRNITGFRDVNAHYRDARLGAHRLIAIYFPSVMLLADLGAVAVLLAGDHLVATGAVTTGVVIAFLLYLNQFFAPIQQLSQVFDQWQQAAASVDKIAELLETPTGTPPAEHPLQPRRPARGEVRFEGVRFRYASAGPDGDEALAGVDLRIAPGETVALVGETGAGKSTVVKLIARFYDPTEGRITSDGIDLRDLDLGAYRRTLGYVPQEAFLFTGTIRDNIAYGRPDATDAEVEAAARAVGAHELVAGLPGGYLAPVSERGRSLSAGERQLIALARAQLVDPAILLLDEATSQLDLASEARVQQAMGVVASGRTTVLVAHRLPTARQADRILVVEHGHVVETGTHDHLVALGGRYAQLWAAFSTADAPAA